MNEQREINILLVEDTEEHAVIVKRMLEDGKLNSRIFLTRDGQAALDFLYHHGDYADGNVYPRPDIILLDLKLPKVNGLEMLARIKGEDGLKDIPVVVLTASDEAKDILTSYERGADSYLTKSVLFLSKGAEPTVILDTVISMAGV